VDSIEQEVSFLASVFGATADAARGEDATAWQVEAKLGETTIKIGHADQGAPATESVFYVWIDDLDSTFARAMSASATSIREPSDQPKGIREACVRDPQGITWWMGQRPRRMSTHEGEEKLRQQRQARM
jgi:uncharacterized glyoxalase superfamily protein PhnB